MASGKRASMREGPLAALFRSTDEEEGAEGGAREPERPLPEPVRARGRASAPQASSRPREP